VPLDEFRIRPDPGTRPALYSLRQPGRHRDHDAVDVLAAAIQVT